MVIVLGDLDLSFLLNKKKQDQRRKEKHLYSFIGGLTACLRAFNCTTM